VCLPLAAGSPLDHTELLKGLTVIHEEFDCEGFWMVIRDPELDLSGCVEPVYAVDGGQNCWSDGALAADPIRS
jgi:hypothetical protein